MLYWKQKAGRLAFSTASLAIIGGLGGLLGAIAGFILALMFYAFVASPFASVLVPVAAATGLLLGVAWGFSLLLGGTQRL